MRLGQLIDTLAAMPHDAPVQFSTGQTPGMFYSWRGVYAELTLAPAEWEGSVTVADLLRDAKDVPGKAFQGYKGGDYLMDRDTPVWADDYGCCDYNAITGIAVEDGRVVLQVSNIEDYR